MSQYSDEKAVENMLGVQNMLGVHGKRILPPAAERALAEAAERRRRIDEAAARPREIDGRGGAEPVRFGDWEVKGLATDF